MKSDFNIALIGAGNVATHLGRAFVRAGMRVCSVAARNFKNAQQLAQELNAKAYSNIDEVPTDVDFVVISTNDASVSDVAAHIKKSRAVVLHTSGSIDISVLSRFHQRCGVLYPLQTFSKDVDVDVSKIPFFTEGDEAVDVLARKISDNIFHADSQKRKYLHIAGVLTSNFPIYMLEIAKRTLAEAGYPLEVVKPLVEVSMAKAFKVGPENALTGPARRGDKEVINKHIEHLSGSDAEVYRAISNAILKHYHSEQD